MATVADYTVLSDGVFDLDHGESHDLQPFFPPEGLVKGTNRAKAILSYKARPLPNAPFAPQCQLKIRFRQLEIETVTIRDDTVRGLWEAFTAAEFTDIVGNVFTFESLQGPVRISDVILWYQLRV